MEQITEFARHHIKLSQPQEGGSSLKAHLEHISRQTGKTHPELVEPPLASEIRYLWDYFIEINSGRQSGVSANPLSWSEIKNWSELTEIKLKPWEVRIIKIIDTVLVNQARDQNG